ncbi:MAG: SIR2 family protein [Phycisphaerales bacterium]|nr:SIR2 family protein [Phycisphaerales bacterium]
MIDGCDRATTCGLRVLEEIVRSHNKPLVYWLGAGCSAWNGYPRWTELAAVFHREYTRYEVEYDESYGDALRAGSPLPDFFQYCKQVSPKRHNRTLKYALHAHQPTQLYRRFLTLLTQLHPLYILTTNIDSSLESGIANLNTINRRDIDQCADLVQTKTPFLAKLHGCISSLDTTVFTSSEYEALVADQQYAASMQRILDTSCVVFLGYGLSEEYVIDLLLKSEQALWSFGSGPHFILTADRSMKLPEAIMPIRYTSSTHKDHRGAFSILAHISDFRSPQRASAATSDLPSTNTDTRVSRYFLADFFPPGKWNTSDTLEMSHVEQEKQLSFMVGTGFDTSELDTTQSTALHDLLTGLVCFDTVYAPLKTLPRIHSYVGSNVFWDLVESSALRFVFDHLHIGVTFEKSTDYRGGSLVLGRIGERDGTPSSCEDFIQRVLKPNKSNFKRGESRIANLPKYVDEPVYDQFEVYSGVKGALLRPHIREMLGIGPALQTDNIPKWLAFPIIRLANIVQVGYVTNSLGISAAKLQFGGASVASAAFSVQGGKHWSDEVASYVVAGRLYSDLHLAPGLEAQVLNSVVRFRLTGASRALRDSIQQSLMSDKSNEFPAAINAGLHEFVPANLLETARNKFSTILLNAEGSSSATPAIWTHSNRGDESTLLWRKRSSRELGAVCNKMGITAESACPCGSGESLAECCGASTGLIAK